MRSSVPTSMATLDVRRLRDEFREPHELVRTSDGAVLFLRHWVASGGSRSAILLLHGITAYSEPYGKLLAEDLARAGVDVFGLDLRGHGRSDGVRGDYPSGERLASDLGETVAFLKDRFATVVVLGHSLGILSAAVAVRQRPDAIDGLVLLSGGRQVRPGAYAKPTARAALKALLGVALFPRRRLIEYRRTGMVGTDDPLFNFRYSARFFSAIYGMSPGSVLKMMRRNTIDSPNLKALGKRDIPVWLGIGDQDEVFAVDSARAFFDSLPFGRKEFVVLPGGRHTSCPPGTWTPLVTWLRDRFPTMPHGGAGTPGP